MHWVRRRCPGRNLFTDQGRYHCQKSAVFLLAFDKKDKFIAAMPALVPDNKKETSQSFMMDKRYTITKFSSTQKCGWIAQRRKRCICAECGIRKEFHADL